jgi:hypothetical protein
MRGEQVRVATSCRAKLSRCAWRGLQVHIGQIHPDVDTDGSHWQVEIHPIADDMSNVARP